MADLASFLVRFPEFQRVPAPQIAAHLGDAALEVNPDLFGTKVDVAIYYLTAHKLATSPWGMTARLVDPELATVYKTHFDNLLAQSAPGVLVI
jgi:hypothetical protein